MDSIQKLQSFNSEVPNSLPLLSCPSEPPDVGNWFSSYKYCSPDPDSNFGLEESASRGTESLRDEDKKEEEANLEMVKTHDGEVAVEKLFQCSTCVEGDKHNEEVCFTKSLDSFSSHSLLSEPPDIRNWFSSYVYESFVPDTCSMYKDDVVSQENDSDKESVDFKASNEDLSENVRLKGSVEHNSSSDENRKGDESDDTVEMKKSLATAITSSHLETILQPCMKDTAMRHNFGPLESMMLDQGSPSCSQKLQIMSSHVKKGSDYRTSEILQKNGLGEAKSEAKVGMSTSLAKSFSEKSPTCTRNKENDGFVSARKGKYTKANDENSWKKPEKLLLQCSTNAGTVQLLACESEKQGSTKRKALTDATNVVQSNSIEITGKWKCPQKGKPYVGPALKQLRLEKWVRRV